MKKLFGLLAAAGLAASAGSVMAEGGAQPQGGAGQQQPGMEQYKGAEKQAQAHAGHHQVTGRIVDIDKKKGNLKVETEQGQLEFLFPPASLQGYKEGDQVRLDVQIRPAEPQKQPEPQPKK